MIRSSTPSKRGQTITRPGPAAHWRAFACVKGAPRGLMIRRGRSSPSPKPRRPGSPRARRRGSPCLGRRRPAYRRPRDGAQAPARECHMPPATTGRAPARRPPVIGRAGPGNICGNRVRMVQANIGLESSRAPPSRRPCHARLRGAGWGPGGAGRLEGSFFSNGPCLILRFSAVNARRLTGVRGTPGLRCGAFGSARRGRSPRSWRRLRPASRRGRVAPAPCRRSRACRS